MTRLVTRRPPSGASSQRSRLITRRRLDRGCREVESPGPIVLGQAPDPDGDRMPPFPTRRGLDGIADVTITCQVDTPSRLACSGLKTMAGMHCLCSRQS